MTTPQQQMQSQVLGYVRQSNQVASQLADIMTETWSSGALPAGPGGPQGDVLPRPAEFVDRMFDFWLQMLETQRSFVLSGINALVPNVPAPGQVVRPAPSRARSITDETTSGSVVSPAPSSTAAARTADSTADEHISGAAADAIVTAAAVTANKTATVKETPAETTSTARTPKKRSTAKKTSGPGTTSAAMKTSTAKQKRS